MKNLSGIAIAQRNLYTAGAGLAFVAALIFCGAAMPVPELRIFSPFQNEFLCLARLVLWFSAFLIGYSHAPHRKNLFGSSAYSLFCRYCFGLVPLLFLCFPNGFSGKYFHLMGWALFCLPVGLFAGELRQYVVRPVHYHISCLAGAAAGVFTAWLLRLRPGLIEPKRILALMLFILIWVIFRRIWQWKYGRLFRIVSMILWGVCIVFSCGNIYPVSPAETSSGREIIPAEIAMSGLQPACKDLNVLTIGDNRHLTDGLASFPLTRKLLAVSSKDSTGLRRLLDHTSGEFDLIVLELPLPDSMYALNMYSPTLLKRIRRALAEDGVLAVFLPDDVPLAPAGLHRGFGLHDLTVKNLKTIFPSVKSAGGELPILFCGEENVTNSPEELNRRARELKLMPAYLPDDAFSLLPPPEEQQLQADMGFRGLDLMRKVIRKDPLINLTGLGALLDRIWDLLLPSLIGILILLLVIRYFFSGGTANKRNWLSLENGLYLGLTAVLLLVPYQLNTGRLDPDWLSLTGIFLIGAFAGMLASTGHHHSKLLQKLLLCVSLLAPWCGLAFLRGYYLPDPLLYYALAGYVGYTSGMIAADIRSEPPVILTGFVIGLMIGILLCWHPDGAVWAPVLAVLCRIPPLAAENLQKQFEKSPGRG